MSKAQLLVDGLHYWATLDGAKCTEFERYRVRPRIRFTEGQVVVASRIDRAFESSVDDSTPLLTAALGLTALVMAAPGTFFLSWTAINEFKAGFLLAGAVFALVALLPFGAGVLATRRHHNLDRSFTASIVAGGLQLLFLVVLLFFVPWI